MGRLQADPPLYYPDQPQSQPEYDPQPQEYQFEAATDAAGTLDDESAPTYETNYYGNENQQESYQVPQQPSYNYTPKSDPQSQQQFQPPPPQQPPQYHPQNTQPPPPPQLPPQYHPQNTQPQANPAYPTQPVRPAQYRPQSPQMNPTYPNQPAHYPPQMVPPRTPPTNYPPQAIPQAFPPQAAYQPPQPVQFACSGYSGYPAMPPSPHKPDAHINGPAPGIPAVVPNQYPQPMPMQVGTEGWKTGLFDCMDDPANALVTACFPCLTFGQVAEIVDNGHTTCGTSGLLYGLVAFFIGLPCLMSCTYRTKLRSKFGLVEAPAPDWVTHFLCECCALCQEYRELQLRGIDPSIGWQGNVERNQNMQLQQHQIAMMPPMNQTMMG